MRWVGFCLGFLIATIPAFGGDTLALHCSDALAWLHANVEMPPGFTHLIVTSSKLAIGTDETQTRMGKLQIYDREQGKEAGSIGLSVFGVRSGLISIAVDENKRQGIGTEALFLIVKYGFHTSDYDHIYSSISANNKASRALHEKLGFEEAPSEGDGKVLYVLSKQKFEALENTLQTRERPRAFFIPRTPVR